MSYDLGAVVPLSITIRDGNDAPADATDVNLTITLPDGTTAAVGPIASTTTGVYDHDYQTVQAGRHSVRWVATGLNAGAFTDVFNVDAAEPYQLVSLAEAKSHLNIPATDTTVDSELMQFVRATTGAVERYVGSIVRRTWTETYDSPGGRSRLLLGHPPVLSVSEVVESGTTLAAADYKVNKPAGVLTRVSGNDEYPWLEGVQHISVTYVAGRTVVEEHWQRAALVILQHLWETQRNTDGGRPALGEVGDDVFDARSGYAIPRRAVELLGEGLSGIA